MVLSVAILGIGVALFIYGTRTTRLQLRTLGAAAMALGVVTIALPMIFD